MAAETQNQCVRCHKPTVAVNDAGLCARCWRIDHPTPPTVEPGFAAPRPPTVDELLREVRGMYPKSTLPKAVEPLAMFVCDKLAQLLLVVRK
jgi:hypothetical protein